MTASMQKPAQVLSRAELNEEIAFFRDVCGWSEKKVEEHLGLADGTLAQRRSRAQRRLKAKNK